MEILVRKKKISTTDCKHIFCEGCLEKWLEVSLACPMCRNQISYYQRGGKKIVPSPPAPSRAVVDDNEAQREAFEFQMEQLFTDFAREVLSSILSHALSPLIEEHIERPLYDERLDEGLVHRKEAFPIGCFDHLMKEFQGLWKRTEKFKKSFEIHPRKVGRFPTLKLIMDEVAEGLSPYGILKKLHWTFSRLVLIVSHGNISLEKKERLG